MVGLVGCGGVAGGIPSIARLVSHLECPAPPLNILYLEQSENHALK